MLLFPLDLVGRCCGCFDLRHRSPLSEPEGLCLLCLLPLPRFESERVRPWCWSLYPRLLPLDISLYRFGVFVVCGLILLSFSLPSTTSSFGYSSPSTLLLFLSGVTSPPFSLRPLFIIEDRRISTSLRLDLRRLSLVLLNLKGRYILSSFVRGTASFIVIIPSQDQAS